MDKSAYQRTHTGRRRKHPSYSRQKTSRRSRLISFLLACAGIFVFAVGINYAFPHFSKAVGDKVSSVVDYRSAFAAIGEGLSGDKKLGEALTEAWAEAFDKKDESGEMPVMTDRDETSHAAGRSELTDAVISAFAESQREYADYMTPVGVDYSLI